MSLFPNSPPSIAITISRSRRLTTISAWPWTGPPTQGPPPRGEKRLLDPLEEILEGPVTLEGGRFYLTQSGIGKLEAYLLAEGLRKLAALDYLVANGTLTDNSILFWDEPESSLNPGLARKLAAMLCVIANAGTQVILATHTRGSRTWLTGFGNYLGQRRRFIGA